jgi:hypothetical protein
MATKRWYWCPKCSEKKWAPRLFDALYQLVDGKLAPCTACGTTTQLVLKFAYKLGVRRTEEKAVAGFVSPRCWPHDGKKVTFHPFLVITEADAPSRKQKIWLPYYHTENGMLEYGQWAPCMDKELFTDLVTKAQKAGYL